MTAVPPKHESPLRWLIATLILVIVAGAVTLWLTSGVSMSVTPLLMPQTGSFQGPVWIADGTPQAAVSAFGTYARVNEEGLALLTYDNPAPGIAMQLQVGYLDRTPGGLWLPDAAANHVTCTLTQEQAALVRAKGLPGALEKAILEQAGGKMGAQRRQTKRIVIDPTPYFGSP